MVSRTEPDGRPSDRLLRAPTRERRDAMRYAIYFVPEPRSRLGRFGAGMLGYDCDSGSRIPFPSLPDVSAEELERFTAEPRRYGFHATLKPPFRLLPSASEADLLAIAETFAQRHRAIQLPTLTLTPLKNFLALVPTAPCPGLDALAGDAVRAFEHLRAPLTTEDRAKRLRSELSARQAAYLEAWGYPYVLDEFEFHMTLTGPLEPTEQNRLLSALEGPYAGVVEPETIASVTISRQMSPEVRFRTLARISLQG